MTAYSYLTDITKRVVFGVEVDERKTSVFGCKLVGTVDCMITSMAKSSFI
jgi:hypothetical protein